MPRTLYFSGAAPSSRIALATAKAIGLDVIVKEVDLLKKEHLSDEYVKMNPQHTVPTLDDNGFIIWDSHVISTYLVSQYAKDDTLYPKDLKKRAVVDQRLFFNEGILYSRLRAIVGPLAHKLKPTVDKDKKDAAYEALAILEKYVQPSGWLAGDHATVADIACAVTVSSMEAIGFHLQAYPKTVEWLKRCRSSIRGFQEVDGPGAKHQGEFIRSYVLPNELDP